MASGQVLEKLRKYYSQCDNEVKKYDAAHARLVSILGTLTNIFERLPALHAPTSYGPLIDIVPKYQERLLSKQLCIIEDLMGKLQHHLQEMAIAVGALDKIHKNAERSVLQDKKLTPIVRRLSTGPVPSIDQCLDDLNMIRTMYSDELKVQQALVAQVQYEPEPTAMADITMAVTARVNIEEQRVKDVFHVIAAATADR